MRQLSRNEKIAVFVSVIAVAVILINSGAVSFLTNYFLPKDQPQMELQNFPAPTDSLAFYEIALGSGSEASPGSVVSVHYTGSFPDGTTFDSSAGRDPLIFTIGAGEVIKGFEDGILGMKEGGKRKIVVPPALGYGSQEVGPIPANSTLVFEIELVDLR